MHPQLRPHARHDLTDRPAPARLAYPADDVLVVSGLPGSGKSTLMRRCARARVIDSQHTRAAFARALPGVPYALYRPLVRLAHYLRLRAALRAGGPLVVHDCGTLPWVRRALARRTARQGRRLHLLLLDASPAQAADGQRRRGRRVSRYAFARHRRAWAALRALATADGPLPPNVASAVLLPREAAARLTAIEFTSPDGPLALQHAVPAPRQEPLQAATTG
ncbi:AAA family ATPase [Kitasatospora phosalacinea]|uniref:ATP-binding protein n=1 Tax=Kitasatospora phosalacinea TaxID=2065 RepID=A0A9W6USH1_9ACTN|nr:AAA family ATPase [Kitasatospora phosalacinea]GLW59444.1 ATP-binding protein [Kitasatospora phosalacinea]